MASFFCASNPFPFSPVCLCVCVCASDFIVRSTSKHLAFAHRKRHFRRQMRLVTVLVAFPLWHFTVYVTLANTWISVVPRDDWRDRMNYKYTKFFFFAQFLPWNVFFLSLFWSTISYFVVSVDPIKAKSYFLLPFMLVKSVYVPIHSQKKKTFFSFTTSN